MNDAIDRLISERAAMDRGFSGGLLVSGAVHLLLVGAAIAGPLLLPRPPIIKIADGLLAPQLPPGGAGSPNPQPPAPVPPKTEAPKPKQEPPKPPPEKKEIIKPPKEEAPSKGVAPLDSKAKKPKTTPKPARQPVSGSGPAGATGNNQTPGMNIGLVPGPGVPNGTDPNGDWYLAGVQRKIWGIWTQQIHADMAQSVTVRFTIVADGAVEDVDIAEGSGVYLLDTAAKRAVMTAAPFSPLPKAYDSNRITITATFHPAQ